LGPFFPFIHPTLPDSLPAHHNGLGEMHGILVAMPVHFSALVAIAWAWNRRREPKSRALFATLLGALAISSCAAGIFFCWLGLESRYLAELCSGMTFVTAVGLMHLLRPAPPGRSRLPGILAVCAAVWTLGYTWLASADFKGYMKRTSPGVFAAIAHVCDYPSLWQAQKQGMVFGPVDLVIRIPGGSTDEWTPVLASGRPGMTNQLVLERTATGRYRFRMVDDQHTSVLTPELVPRDGALRVHVEAPWLYPPTEHPYWDGIGDPTERARLQSHFMLGAEGGQVEATWSNAPDPVAYEPSVRAEDSGAPLTPWVASLSRSGDPARLPGHRQ